jgi:pimeloyl-ACP methyl ester carboxylesterase
MLRRPPRRLDAERTLALPDGRLLGYAEHGDPDALPLLFFHGTPGSRYLGREADGIAREAGIRVIALERPGYGLSDDHRGYRVSDWPSDVAIAANAFGLQRFAVAGHSGGAPYALACAALLGERVTSVTIVSPGGPEDDLAASSSMEHRLIGWSRNGRSRRVGLLASVAAFFIGRFPGFAVSRIPGESDRRLLRDPAARATVVGHLQEAFRHGSHGVADDYAALAWPWGFDLSAVQVPVTIWQGEDDKFVAPSTALALARKLPNASTTLVPNTGHRLIFERAAEILGGLGGPSQP